MDGLDSDEKIVSLTRFYKKTQHTGKLSLRRPCDKTNSPKSSVTSSMDAWPLKVSCS
jgi:hypothetical protein